jgi:hypothetical protein
MTEPTTASSAPAASATPASAQISSERPADWSAAFDTDTRALVAAKGWRGPEDALKSYAHLERLVGGEKIAVPPADAPTEAWHAVYARLGRPARAEDYTLAAPEGLADYSEELAAGFRKAAHAAGLSARQASALHDFYVNAAAERARADAAADDMAGAELASALQRAWGPQYEAKVASARRAARAFAPPEALEALERAMAAPQLVALFARIGEAMGEDRLTEGAGEGAAFALGPDAAKAEIARIEGQMTDPKSPLMDRIHPEHEALVRRRDALYRLAFPE